MSCWIEPYEKTRSIANKGEILEALLVVGGTMRPLKTLSSSMIDNGSIQKMKRRAPLSQTMFAFKEAITATIHHYNESGSGNAFLNPRPHYIIEGHLTKDQEEEVPLTLSNAFFKSTLTKNPLGDALY